MNSAPLISKELVPADAVVEALLRHAPDAVWVVDQQLVLVRFNHRFAQLCEKITEVTPEIGMSLDELLDPVMDRRVHAFFRDLYSRVLVGRPIDAEQTITLDGARRTFTLAAVPVTSDGAVRAAMITARERKRTRRRDFHPITELSLSRLFDAEGTLEDALRSLIEFLSESDGWDGGVAWMAEQDELVFTSSWFRPSIRSDDFCTQSKRLRWTRGHGLPGRAWQQRAILWVPDLLDESGVVRGRLAARARIRSDVIVPLSDGDSVIGVIELFSRSVRPPTEERREDLAGVGLAVGRLISRRQAFEERERMATLIERKGIEWQTTFDAIELPILMCTTSGEIVRLNRAARDLAGADYADLVGRSVASIGAGEPWRTLEALVQSTRDVEASNGAHIDSGEESWDVTTSFFTLSGEPRIIIAMRNISTLVRLQEAVRRGEQLSALGELVAGVAHEVRNPVFGLLVSVDALEPLIGGSPDTVELFEAMRQWLHRLNRLMESLLEYGKTWTVNLKPGGVDDVIHQALAACRPAAEVQRLMIEEDVEAHLTALMDSSRLVHVFENVITNALQHSPEGGRLTVRARKVTRSGNHLIECSVHDEGPGFTPFDLPRVFQPFYTKRRGGTGLGLSIVQRIVEEHGGTVSAENHPAGGALVTIRIPVFGSQ